jgi:hypothetical protein
VLQEAEGITGLGRQRVTNDSGDHTLENHEGDRKPRGTSASSSSRDTRILVINRDPISRNRRESRRAL